jgi:hypothetical protein
VRRVDVEVVVDCDPVAPEVVDFEVEEKDKKEAQISPQDSESILNGVARLVGTNGPIQASYPALCESFSCASCVV